MLFLFASRAVRAALLAIPLLTPACDRRAAAARPQVGCTGCTVLQGGTVFDGSRAGRGTVVIEGDKVKEVVFGDSTVVAGDVVDVTGKTVLPGFVDLHVHLMSGAGPLGASEEQWHEEDYLKAMLRSGVTSFLDLGSSERIIFEYRRRLQQGSLFGPRLFAVGPLLTPTGGHPCYAGSPPGDMCIFVDSMADAAAGVDKLLPEKPDLVKIVIEGGVSKPLPRMPEPAMAAIQQAAASGGARVIAHVSRNKDVEDALDAGVRLFAHVVSEEVMPEDLAARMASLGVVVVPTAATMDGYDRVAHDTVTELADPALRDDVPAEVIAALKDPKKTSRMTTPSYRAMTAAWRKNALLNIATLTKAGVTIATGTDAGNPATFHGLAMARELAMYVEAGLSPVEALHAGTRAAADVLKRPDLGRLEPGSAADVVVVNGDATQDIAAVKSVYRVYKAGAPVDREALALPRGESLSRGPVTKVPEGGTCLHASECGAGLACDDSRVCAKACTHYGDCQSGTACMPVAGSATQGACFAGDGCDLLAQDCTNGAACIPLGNGATTCWIASPTPLGAPCGPGYTCGVGAVCDLGSARCMAMCDPAGKIGAACPAGKSCVDYSDITGVAVGECK
jgi:imidazolonepropionase-like amidohydrolase